VTPAPQVRFGLWQRSGYTRDHIPRSEGGHSGASSGGEMFCVTATNYKRMFDLEGSPSSGWADCARSHERWKGNKYTASVECKTNTGYEHTDVWVTVHDPEHVSIGESTGSLTDGASSFGQDEAQFVSANCGKYKPR
jgi:hypothetical protein